MKIVRIARKGGAGKGNAEQDAEKLVNGMARITAARIKGLDWFADGRFDPMKMSLYEIVLNLFDEELYYEAIKFISFVFHANGEHDIGHIVSSVIASTDKTRHEFLSKVIQYADIMEEYDEFMDFLKDMEEGEERWLP